MTGTVGILNVGEGDTKLSFDPSSPAEAERSARIVRDMIRRGFVLLIEVGRDEKGPVYRRAHDFDPETAEYIIAGDLPPPTTEETTDHEQEPRIPKARRGQGKARRQTTRLAASKTSAVAVARTAGG